jgi:TonB family protein
MREVQQSESDETQALLGATINGSYRIVSLIARGGMGKVYRAEQSALGRVCALKILSPHYEGNKDPEFHRRFELEASTAAKLQHPNTVTIFDYGRDEAHDVYYIAMEYLDGRTLHRLLHDERTLAEVRASHIAQQICRSVHEAHRIGVVHRDLKPSNVLLVERGDEADFVKVLDFGLVKDVSGKGEDLTQTGLFMGSPKYMAPEQVMGTEISARTDIYSLGVMLYEMISGKVPFDRKAGMSTLVAHVNEAPQPISARNPEIPVSPEMEAIVMRCLEKDPAKRFASMKDLLAHLKRASGDLSDTYESLPRARVDYDAALKQGKSNAAPSNRASVPPPSGSGTLRSNLVAAQNPSGNASGTVSLESLERSTSEISAPRASAAAEIAAPESGSGFDSLSPPQVSRTFTGSGERPSSAAWRPYALVVLASVLGGGTAAVVISKRSEPGRPVVTAQAPPSVAIAVSPTSEAPRGPDVRILRIESEPTGAVVTDQGVQVCMHTPCDVYWQGKNGKLEHTLLLEKRGFKTVTLTVAPDDEKVTGKLEAWGYGDVSAVGASLTSGNAAAAGKSADTAQTATSASTLAAAPPLVAPPAAVAAPEAPPAAPAVVPTMAPLAGSPMHLQDVDTRPTRISGANPSYPREAVEAKVSGTVVAKCVITESGSVTGCRIVKGVPFMDQPVLSALSGWRYTPAMSQGKPVAIDLPITIRIVAQ